MEFENLGNFVILEPFFRTLRNEFPDAELLTSLQLSEDFSRRFNLSVIHTPLLWSHGYRVLFRTLLDLFAASLWRFIKFVMKLDIEILHKTSRRSQEIKKADLVLDFSGDMFGDNAQTSTKFFIAIIVPIIARLLGTPIAFVASSPGPFTSLTRLWAAKYILRNYIMIATREPLSCYNLNFAGISGKEVKWYPCPSVGFRPDGSISMDELMRREPRLMAGAKPLVGLIPSHLNMMEPPEYKWPREDYEFENFIKLVTYITDELGAKVCVFSHQNKVSKDNRLVPGPDHQIVNRLLELLPQKCSEDVFTLNNIYDAPTINTIVGQFEVLISGRIHGAMQGISQYIPTVIIDYGMNSNATKLKGFAIMTGLYEYICDSSSDTGMITTLRKVWDNRDYLKSHLARKIPELELESRALWKDIKESL